MEHETNVKQSATVGAGTRSTGDDRLRLLLQSYPDLSQAETEEAIRGYRELTPVQHAILVSDPNMARSLGRFGSDHRRQLRTPFRHYAPLFFLAVFSLLLCAWLFLTP